ncbi:MAG: hypothetical protein ACMUIA_02065 [bacterium]
MPGFARWLLTIILVFSILQAVPVTAQSEVSICGPDGLQSSGAVYRICMPPPENWNGDLVVYAHGFVAFNLPVEIPEDHLQLPDGTSLPEIINSLGYAFATTSYSTNGLAVRQGLPDVRELVDIFITIHGHPRFTYVVGVSEGGLIAAKAIERYPEVFDGALAASGPIGDFRRQVNSWGDFRVVFDYFFPEVIPGSPVDIPQEVIDTWDEVFIPRLQKAIRSNRRAALQLLRVTGTPFDLKDPSSMEKTILDLLRFHTMATNDAVEKLGGQPFDNMSRIYRGSGHDLLLNRTVQRFAADQAALDEIEAHYQTTGRLARPMVTLHTTKDPIIPYWHDPIYRLKAALHESMPQHTGLPSPHYGHCHFTAGEVLTAFTLLVFKVTGRQDRRRPSRRHGLSTWRELRPGFL